MTTPTPKSSQKIFWLLISLIVVLLILGFFVSNIKSKRDAVTVAVADVRDTQIAELQKEIEIKTDSILIIRSDRDDLIKLIVAQEAQLKKHKPNEAQILKTYQSLSDSAAYAIFMERYSKEGKFTYQ